MTQTKTKKPFQFSAESLNAALGPRFRIKDFGDEMEIDNERGAALGWVRSNPVVLEIVFMVLWRREGESDDSDDVLDTKQVRALALFNEAHRARWEKAGYSVPEEGEIGYHSDDGETSCHYEIWLSKPVKTVADIVIAIPELKETSNDWLED